MNIWKQKTIYLDHASATPLSSGVIRAMNDVEKKTSGANPSAIYDRGVLARRFIDDTRASIAKSLSAHSDEIIFTGSGTESDALAVLGIVRAYKGEGVPHIITTKIEHSAILENCRMLESGNEAEVTYIDVDENGIVNPKDIRDSLKENTILVSVMYANNEIGTIQPIEEIAKEIRYFRKNNNSKYPFFHTDACQAMNYLFTENIEKLGVDLLSFNGSKIYGPKGVGILFKKRGINIAPLYAGGGQEFGLRSGTENVAGIVGLGHALKDVSKIKKYESDRLSVIRDYAIEKLLNLSSESGYAITLNGDRKNRLPNNINISIGGISSELLVVELDAQGILVSEKSACGSTDDGMSHVVTALRHVQGLPIRKDEGSLRISLGRSTKKKDIDIFIRILNSILKKYKQWK